MEVRRTIGRYKIIEELGKGGMGVVYKAEERESKEIVALKILPPELTIDPIFITRFKREADSIRQLDHPNIVKLYEVGEEGTTYFMAMEFVDGGSLHDLLHKEGKIELQRALKIALQVADALAYAHEKGIIHRDIKPTNIMLTKKREVKLTDFGVAKRIGKTQVTTTGTIIGTPEYMSPEQTEGKFVDRRSDIYSLGAVLYEMLTGRVPFKGDTPMEVLRKQKFSLPEPARLLNPDIPSRVDTILNCMLEKEPSRRYSSAHTLSQAIRNYLEAPIIKERELGKTQVCRVEDGEVLRPSTSQPSEDKLTHRGKVASLAFMVSLLVLIGVIFWKVTGDRKGTDKKSINNLGVQYKWGLMVFKTSDFRDEVDRIVKLMETQSPGSQRVMVGALAERARKYFNAGNLAYLNRRYESAISNYNNSLDVLETSCSFNNLGNVYMKVDKFDEAVHYYQKALSLNPVNIFYIHNNLGLAYMQRGDFVKAEEVFLKYLKHDPENSKIKGYLKIIKDGK